jgi:hypothetical protein
MILESAQMLSTAHRILDGNKQVKIINGRKRTVYILPNVQMNDNLYGATHINHPSTVWARSAKAHYQWLFIHFKSLTEEYTRRYKKNHKCEFLFPFLENLPHNIPDTIGFSQPPQCMPDDVKQKYDSVQAYRDYYIKYKSKFAVWKYSDTPAWYNSNQ